MTVSGPFDRGRVGSPRFHRRLGGFEYTIGYAYDKIHGERVVYCPWLDPALADTRVLRAILKDSVGCLDRVRADRIVLRLPVMVEPRGCGWHRTATYIRHAVVPGLHAPSSQPSEACVTIEEQAEAASNQAIASWLRSACIEGAKIAHGVAPPHSHVGGYVDAIMRDPGRLSLVATCTGQKRAVGHLTMLQGKTSDWGRPESIISLVDMLVVEDADCASQARKGLTAMALDIARDAKSALWGNVIHRRPSLGADRSGAVLAKLRRQGWEPVYSFWSADLTQLQ